MKRVAELAEVRSRAGGFLNEFWAFAAKGNVFDLAVAVILGNAFGAVVNSLVADVVMPFLSIATGSLDNLSSLNYTLGGRVLISYGHFLQVLLNFLVIALAIFLMFKLITTLRKRVARTEAAHPESKPEPSAQEKILIEIRDTLKQHLESQRRE